MNQEIKIIPKSSRKDKDAVGVLLLILFVMIGIFVFKPNAMQEIEGWFIVLGIVLFLYLYIRSTFYKEIIISSGKIYFKKYFGNDRVIELDEIIGFDGVNIELKKGIFHIAHIDNCNELHHFVRDYVNKKRDDMFNEMKNLD